VKHLGQLLIMTNEEPQLSPSLLAAIQLGYAGGVLLRNGSFSSITALQDQVWRLRETAKLGGRSTPLILLELSDALLELWPIPSLGAMAVSGLTDDVHRIFNTMALIWRQIGITGVIGPGLGVYDPLLDPWNDKRAKYAQLFVRELRQNGLDPFVHIDGNQTTTESGDLLTAVVDSGLSGALFTPHSLFFRPYSWREHANFQGLLVQELIAREFLPADVPAGINNGFDMVVLPTGGHADPAYHALLVAMNQRRLSKRKIYSSVVRVRSLKGLDLPLPWNASVTQRPMKKWAQHIWDHALVHTGVPYSGPSSRLMLVEFGRTSWLKSLLRQQLDFYQLLNIDPDIRDMFHILSLVQQKQGQLIIHLNDATHHLNQSILFPLCQPRPIGVAMSHPSDLFLLPQDATGLTNFDSHPGAYQSIAAAILGRLSVRGRWLSPQEVTQS
jgi:hypothetical protein